jgi:hypothetical protein
MLGASSFFTCADSAVAADGLNFLDRLNSEIGIQQSEMIASSAIEALCFVGRNTCYPRAIAQNARKTASICRQTRMNRERDVQPVWNL